MPSPAEIAKHPLIVGPSSPRRVLTERLFRDSGESLNVAAEVTFSPTMRVLVREGVAPAFVPYLLSGVIGSPSKAELPCEPQTVAYDMSGRLKGGALPFGLLYRAGKEESVALSRLGPGVEKGVDVISCVSPLK